VNSVRKRKEISLTEFTEPEEKGVFREKGEEKERVMPGLGAN
jgi:hypothetical protein